MSEGKQMRYSMKKRYGQLLTGALVLVVQFFSAGPASAIPAILPSADSVPMREAMPIDGVWTVSTINKRIRLEGGRAYAMDPWLHMFVLEVQPGMVVIQNLMFLAPGEYRGHDLPLMGTVTFRLKEDGRLSGVVQTGLGPMYYDLIPESLDDPAAFQQELAAVGGGGVPVMPGPVPLPVEPCNQLVVDPETNQQVCLD